MVFKLIDSTNVVEKIDIYGATDTVSLHFAVNDFAKKNFFKDFNGSEQDFFKKIGESIKKLKDFNSKSENYSVVFHKPISEGFHDSHHLVLDVYLATISSKKAHDSEFIYQVEIHKCKNVFGILYYAADHDSSFKKPEKLIEHFESVMGKAVIKLNDKVKPGTNANKKLMAKRLFKAGDIIKHCFQNHTPYTPFMAMQILMSHYGIKSSDIKF